MTLRFLGPILVPLLWSVASSVHADSLPRDLLGWWLTPDQQGARLAAQGRHLAAAERFEDPARRAAAWYRGGDFERAAAAYGRIGGADAAYNRGNALVMLGRYDEAIESYQRALALEPGWSDAADNLSLAMARQARLAPPDSDAGGTGGQLEADDFVVDESGRVDRGGSEVTSEEGVGLSEQELRATWLRRVQNDPADFLRARFAWQLARQEAPAADD
jgi:Ca-activated chloride channel family protein